MILKLAEINQTQNTTPKQRTQLETFNQSYLERLAVRKLWTNEINVATLCLETKVNKAFTYGSQC